MLKLNCIFTEHHLLVWFSVVYSFNFLAELEMFMNKSANFFFVKIQKSPLSLGFKKNKEWHKRKKIKRSSGIEWNMMLQDLRNWFFLSQLSILKKFFYFILFISFLSKQVTFQYPQIEITNFCTFQYFIIKQDRYLYFSLSRSLWNDIINNELDLLLHEYIFQNFIIVPAIRREKFVFQKQVGNLNIKANKKVLSVLLKTLLRERSRSAVVKFNVEYHKHLLPAHSPSS